MEKTVENKQAPVQPPVASEQSLASVQTHAPEKNGQNGQNGHQGVLKPYMLDIAGGITGIVAGIVAATKSVNNKFFANALKNKMFAKENKERKISMRELHRAEEGQKAGDSIKAEDAGTRKLKYGYLKGEEYISAKAQMDETWYRKVNAKLDKREINTIWDKFRSLSPHQRWEVRLGAFAVGAVAIGGFLNLASSMRLSKKQSELKERINELENKTQAQQQ